MIRRRVVVSLHDVTPRHEATIERILKELSRIGIPPVPLLVVPDFHGQWPLAKHPRFVEKLIRWHAAGHELVLHGYWHREIEAPSPTSPTRERLQRSFMTGGEGEFLALSALQIGDRLDAGLEHWKKAGLPGRPTGFIPPAWLHNTRLDRELWSRGFLWTENHAGMRFHDGSKIPNPVISWASRDILRRLGSLVVCPHLERRWRDRLLMRIAVHPHDFDWPLLEGSIRRVLARAERHGRWATPSDLVPAV